MTIGPERSGEHDAVQPPAPATEAFKRLYLKVIRRANEMARRLMPDDEAEDVASEVGIALLAAWRVDPAAFETEKVLARWLRLAVRSTVVDALRKEQRRDAREVRYDELQSLSPSGLTHPALELEVREFEELVGRTLADMPRRRRETFLRVREKESAYTVVAAERNLSPDTVRLHVRNAMQDFRRCMPDYRDAGFSSTDAPTNASRRAPDADTQAGAPTEDD